MDPEQKVELIRLLEIPIGASKAEVQAAYRRQALRLHPDKGGCPEKMKQLNALYELYKKHPEDPLDTDPLYCEESELSDTDEEDEPDSAYASTQATRDTQQQEGTQRDQRETPGPSNHHVSQEQYDRAYCRLLELKWSLEDLFRRQSRKRKQNLEPEFLQLKRRYDSVPWDVFNNIFPN